MLSIRLKEVNDPSDRSGEKDKVGIALSIILKPCFALIDNSPIQRQTKTL